MRTGANTGMEAGAVALKWIITDRRPKGRDSPGTKKSVSSVDADRGCLENGKDTEREAQGVQGLQTNCTEIMPRLSRLNRGLNNRYHPSPPGKANASSIE